MELLDVNTIDNMSIAKIKEDICKLHEHIIKIDRSSYFYCHYCSDYNLIDQKCNNTECFTNICKNCNYKCHKCHESYCDNCIHKVYESSNISIYGYEETIIYYCKTCN